MARVTVNEVKAWVDQTKLPITTLDAELIAHLEEEILTKLSVAFPIAVPTWTNDTNTPKIVRTIIAKTYASWLYDRLYSEDQEEGNDYAAKLLENANTVLEGIIAGHVIISEDPIPDVIRSPTFYPTDASSAQTPTTSDPSLGGPWFSLGKAF